MDALDDAMKMVQHREEREIAQSIPVQFYVNDDDIDEKMERVYSLVKKNADEYRTTTFANLARLFGSSESILLDLFVPLLFLAHKGRVSMKQDSFFDEIFVMLGERSAAAG
jgi:chromatin segregation and condensation protein Rec8/ScpA/Scc1 (kleisin family)